MLELQHLTLTVPAEAGQTDILKDVSLTVEDHRFIVITGPNGGGKTSLAKVIMGLNTPTSGKILWNGEDITGMDPQKVVSKGIAMVPEGRRVFSNLTVAENLKIGAYLRTDSLEDDIRWVYDLFPRLKERSWQAAGTLSGGEQQMLAVGRALMARPKLIMMDEPSLGLAPIVVKGIFEIIKEINRKGVTVLLIEQNANMALQIADVGYVMETGRITLKGSGKELLANEAVRKAYLGSHAK